MWISTCYETPAKKVRLPLRPYAFYRVLQSFSTSYKKLLSEFDFFSLVRL